MSRLFHRPSGGVLLATPAYSDVGAGYAYALHESGKALQRAGIDSQAAILSGDCHVDDARNRIVAEFLAGEYTDLVFLDADVRWEPESLIRLLSYDFGLVGATYPYREGERAFPGIFMQGEQYANQCGLLEVEALPTGFLRIRRDVLEQLAETAPKFMNKAGLLMPLIFERTLEGNHRYGGDITFCRKYRKLGGRVWLDPEIELEHGPDVCSYGHHARTKLYGGVQAGLLEIKHQIETATTYKDMLDEWGNLSFAAPPEFIASAVSLARQSKTVIECGSGLTTLAMRATGVNLISLEDDPEWAKKTGATHAPLVDKFYDHNGHYDLAVIDGPNRQRGDRGGLLRSGITADVYLFDDANHVGTMDIVKQLGEPIRLSERTVLVHGHSARPH